MVESYRTGYRVIKDFGDNYVIRNLLAFFKTLLSDRMTAFFTLVFASLVVLAIFAPVLAPYHYGESIENEQGELKSLEAPSWEHPLGTDKLGRDLLSRLIYGARPTLVSGLLGGTIIISIGLFMGVTAGYVGGRVDNVLMRFTDIVYSVPLLPFAIVLVALFSVDYIGTIIVIGIIIWRGSARVIRSQVLQVRERPFILAAKTSGASTPRIIFKHILPNVAPLAFLYFALGIRATILIQAGLSFLGIGNPFLPSWGIMLRNAFVSGWFAVSPWWSIPPGIMISLAVLSAYMMGRGYEESLEEDIENVEGVAGG
jgi:peptide/nickel transport system permease protein